VIWVLWVHANEALSPGFVRGETARELLAAFAVKIGYEEAIVAHFSRAESNAEEKSVGRIAEAFDGERVCAAVCELACHGNVREGILRHGVVNSELQFKDGIALDGRRVRIQDNRPLGG
jgi:hypothetical protein